MYCGHTTKTNNTTGSFVDGNIYRWYEGITTGV